VGGKRVSVAGRIIHHFNTKRTTPNTASQLCGKIL